jgi:hypothetical protein
MKPAIFGFEIFGNGLQIIKSEFNSLSDPNDPFWDLAVERIKKVDEQL